MTRYQKAGARAIDDYFREHDDQAMIPLIRLSIVADQAAHDQGKVRELFEDLSSYTRLLPEGARTRWHSSLLRAVNPYGPGDPGPDPDHVPGFFDVAVDMGPQAYEGRGVARKDQLELTF